MMHAINNGIGGPPRASRKPGTVVFVGSLETLSPKP